MAESRRGLGRGLSALLQEAAAATSPERRGAAGVVEIDVREIRPNPQQPRKSFEGEEMDELVLSVGRHGVLQPILVRPTAPNGSDYEIIAGERRWRAACAARLRTVPVMVRDLDDDEVAEVALIENLQRADLTALEEAGAYQALMRRRDWSAEQVAVTVGKSRSHVANMVRLLSLPPLVLAMLEHGQITAGHARAMIDRPDALDLAYEVIHESLNVRDTEALVRDRGAKARPRAKGVRAVKDADTRAVESDLAEVLGMAVEIADQGGQGRLTIRYQTLEQLDELCRRLLSRPN